MPHDASKLLEDILLAVSDLEKFCAGKAFKEFEQDRLLQAAVERELEIIGEALFRLRKGSPELLDKIADGEKIIGLRNILAHGYDLLDYEILWDVVANKLPDLKQKIVELQSQG
jgi:uncharacterized protein with HEPN domain